MKEYYIITNNMSHLDYYNQVKFRQLELKVSKNHHELSEKINDLISSFSEIRDMLQSNLNVDNSGYDIDGQYYEEKTLRDTIKIIESKLNEQFSNKLDYLKSILENKMENQQIALSRQLKEIDDMIRYGPISQVMFEAKSDFESHI
jgi:adenylosuccinate synthase